MTFEKIVFAMKTWKDKVSGNTPITAAELNRIEKGINDCAKQTNALGDSVSRKVSTSAGIKSANISQNVTAGGREPIMIRVQADNGADYALCIHLDKTIELYDYASKRPVWSANVASLC